MPTTCEFVFERASAIYYSGEQICGIIVLTTTKDLKVEALQINCRGCANVSWLEHIPHAIFHNDGVTEHQILKHQGYELYIDEYQSQQQLNVIHAGRHEYKFSFQLPANCPATSTHKLGKVFYSINLELKRRTKCNKKYEQKFSVKNRLDLNALAEKYKAPGNALQSFGNDCLKLKFSTARTGYVPGQNIKFRLDIIGNFDACRKNVRLQVRLCQKYIFKCQPPYEQSREVIWKLATTNMDFNTESSLRVPLLAPTSSNATPAIISVVYYLEALVTDNFKRVFEKLFIPITVGTKALKGVDRETREETMYCYDNLMAMESEKDWKQLRLTEVKTEDFIYCDQTLGDKINNDKMSTHKENAAKCTLQKKAEKKMSSLIFTKTWPWKFLKKIWHKKLTLTASYAQNLYNDRSNLLSNKLKRNKKNYFSDYPDNVCMQMFMIL